MKGEGDVKASEGLWEDSRGSGYIMIIEEKDI